MAKSENIFEGIEQKPFSFRRFYKDHKIGILGTLIFHMLILIVFLILKIDSLKDGQELSIVLEYTDSRDELPEETEREETQEEFIERMLNQQLNQSNRAVNVARLEEELSTEKYVDEVLNELDEERSEEWLEQQKELEKILNSEDLVPVQPEPEEEKDETEFSGPTNINYEFLDAPFDRKTRHLPVPVYKCRGNGIVEVSVSVNKSGNVTQAKARVIQASDDAACLSGVAEKFALRTTFRADQNAPSNHSAKIVYNFIAQ